MKLRTGITTGTCAAAAARAAVTVLLGNAPPSEVEVLLPSGPVLVPILYARATSNGAAIAAVRKDAGDDPDVTHGLEVVATVAWHASANAPSEPILFAAGEGVGTVTKPGLQVPPGEPAINPAPRRMIAAAIRQLTSRGVLVTIAIPGGRAIAQETFNPRLGIEGGLSVLGSTGIVRPYCTKALCDALKCALDVAAASGAAGLVLVPGNIGARAVRTHFTLRDEQIVEVGNEWGFVLSLVPSYGFEAIMLLGHPGKLAKLAAGQWDTHSARSQAAAPQIAALCSEVLRRPAPEHQTAEGLFAALSQSDRRRLADVLAARIREAVEKAREIAVAVVLVNMAGEFLGSDGDLSAWR
ncbi:MAG: cobalt-precorrin-5B (C(1))-methyltransferase CbiD [Thermoguttaceae bacterium]|jgi:cobalt-precorrin-5B (C1)-methyltransferase